MADHVDTAAREAIKLLAEFQDATAQAMLHKITGDKRTFVVTPLGRITELFSTPSPEKAQEGTVLKWGCSVVVREQGFDISSRGGACLNSEKPNGWDGPFHRSPAVGVFDTEAEALAALDACQTPPPDWKEPEPKPEAGERVPVARVDPPDGARPYRHITRLSDLHDVPDGTLLYAGTTTLPTPQPAEPKVLPCTCKVVCRNMHGHEPTCPAHPSNCMVPSGMAYSCRYCHRASSSWYPCKFCYPTPTPKGAEWLPLSQIRDGAVFETKGGILAVKSEYHLSNAGDIQCILVESGEYAHFCQDANVLDSLSRAQRHNQTLCREIDITDLQSRLDKAENGEKK